MAEISSLDFNVSGPTNGSESVFSLMDVQIENSNEDSKPFSKKLRANETNDNITTVPICMLMQNKNNSVPNAKNSEFAELHSRLEDAEEEVKALKHNIKAISISLSKAQRDLEITQNSKTESRLELTRELEALKEEKGIALAAKNEEISTLTALIRELNEVIQEQKSALKQAIATIKVDRIPILPDSCNIDSKIEISSDNSEHSASEVCPKKQSYWSSIVRNIFGSKRKRSESIDC